MMKLRLALFIFSFVLVLPVATSYVAYNQGVEKGLRIAPKPVVVDPSVGVSAAADKSIMEEVNEYRLENGKPALVLDNDLNASAQVRAEEIARNGNSAWAHTRPNGSSWTTTVNQYSFLGAGENLAHCYQDNDHVVEAWKNSATHNQNMLGTITAYDWQYIGVGKAWDDTQKCMINVTHYGRR